MHTSVQTSRNRRHPGFGALLVAAALVLAACGSSDAGGDGPTTTKASGPSDGSTTTAPSSGDDELDGRQFTATDVTGYDLVAGTEIVTTFEDGRLSVNAGCNTLSSAYTFDDGTLAWTGEPMATQMACPDDLMAQDSWLTGFFVAGADATLDGQTLTLTYEDFTMTLEQVADAPLVGTSWTLDSTIANDAVSSIPTGTKAPTLAISDDGSAQVFTGCNTGSTTVEIAADTLTVAPMALTRMACEDDAMALENQVTTVLDGEVGFTIEGDALTIRNGDSGLVYRAG